MKRLDLLKGVDLLLCNNITEADQSFIDDNMELFYSNCDECNGQGEVNGIKCDECSGEGQHDLEPYQYYLTRLNEFDKERFNDYGVKYGYSALLDLDVLPVYDFGTSWDSFSHSKEVDDDYELAPYETLERMTVY